MKYKVEPDIALFGKALGNGYAITAIVGKKCNEIRSTKVLLVVLSTERPSCSFSNIERNEKN